MSLSRKDVVVLVLGLSIAFAAVLPDVVTAVGTAADKMCLPTAEPPCPCGQKMGPKGCKADPSNKFGCPCYDITNKFQTMGTCIATNVCKAHSTSGKDGFGLDQVAKLLGDLMGKLMQSGKDSGQQGNETPTTPAQPPTCNISNSIVSSNASSTTARLSWQAHFYSPTGTATTPGSVSISPGVGNVETSGTKDVTVNDVTTYTMTVSDAGGSATCSTTVIGLGGDDDGCTSIFGCDDDDDEDTVGGSITATPRSGAAPLTVAFSAAVDKAGKYIVDFGDDSTDFQIELLEGKCTDGTNFGACDLEVDVRHVFDTGGSYVVKLRDAEAAADAQLDSVSVTVTGGKDDDDSDDDDTGTAGSQFIASRTSGLAPLQVMFTHRFRPQRATADCDRPGLVQHGDGTNYDLVAQSTDDCHWPTTHTYIYQTPGTYSARIAMQDTSLAGEYEVITITVRSNSNTTTDTATTTKQVPVFKNPVFLTPGQSGDIQVIKDGGTVFATMRDPSKNTQISGFYGSYTFNVQPQGVVGRLCQTRPWAAGFLTYIVPASFFDGLCTSRGHQVGLLNNTVQTAPVVTVTQTPPKTKATSTPPKQPAAATSTGSSANSRVRVWAVPATVPLGSRTSVFWTSQNVSNCTVSSPDGSFMQTSLSGGASTVPITTATTFTISCLAPDGTPVTGYTTVTISI